MGYGPCGCKESDTIVVTEHSIYIHASVIRICIICCMQSAYKSQRDVFLPPSEVTELKAEGFEFI